jgi:4-hydroxybenzoate polyprenyltransferase
MLLAHSLSARRLGACFAAFLSLSLCASATYIINDLLDIEADRRHPRKRRRAFASGDLSPVTGVAVIALFAVVGVALALLVPRIFTALPGTAGEALLKPYGFLMWLGIYVVTTLAYSIRLKRAVLIDVFVLSGLYTLRIIAGAAATGVQVSTWLGAFSIFFFLSLAYVKRFSELEMMRERNEDKAAGRGYRTSDLEQVRSLGTASGYASVIVLTIYISSLSADVLYTHGHRLWLLVPVMLLWISRVWLIASRGQMHEDPVVFAIVDKRSWLLGAMAVFVVWWSL